MQRQDKCEISRHLTLTVLVYDNEFHMVSFKKINESITRSQ